MARPKLGDGETQRLHLNIGEEELSEIDDWRYANRIPTRAEAIRRLCRIGLLASTDMPSLLEHAENLCRASAWEHKEALDYLYELNAKEPNEKITTLLQEFADITHDLFDRSFILSVIMNSFYNEISTYSESGSISASDDEAAKQREEAMKVIEAHEETLTRLNEAPHEAPGDKEKWLRAHLDRMIALDAKVQERLRIGSARRTEDDK